MYKIAKIHKKINNLGLLTFIPTLLLSGEVVVSHDNPYFKHKDKKNNVEIIYTKDNLPFAKHTAEVESHIHKNYKDFFDWKLDETLYVGLISSHNQIANGFSTQWANNRQINYLGGTQLIDIFSTTSWLDTLLYHETAHNYQLNVKGSFVSRALHSVFGNGSFIFPLYMVVPNLMENSFLLEGNAVLNESWHGNGGRLYSGINKAQTILQSKSGKIIESYMYNSRLEFPYGDSVYIQGGFYQLYIAEKVGLKHVNSYFKYHSEDFWFPVQTDASMKDAIGVNFRQSLKDFSDAYKELGKDFVEASGEHILSSQFFNSLSHSEDEIFFIINESGVEAPELVIFNKENQTIQKVQDSWLSGKVIKNDNSYYTQGSANTSTTRIHQGLFDKDRYIKEDTKSKMVQGYLSDGKMVYFDVPSSYSQAQLYVEDEFYAQVNSSVIIDKDDNLYYFVQDGKKRTLYKNKTALYSYQGFYGIVSDIDSKGKIYFIANSELGSTLYAFADGKVERSSYADNIKEARLVNDTEFLISAISDKDYYYLKNEIVSIEQEPFETTLFFEKYKYYGGVKTVDTNSTDVDLSNSYNSLLDMHYSGTNATVGYGSYVGWLGSLNMSFGDPLSQNSAMLFVNKDSSGVSVAGAGYSNSQYFLQYSVSGYKVLDNSLAYNDTRKYGLNLNLVLPLYQAGTTKAVLSTSYFQDYTSLSRKPWSTTLAFGAGEGYGNSMYLNYLNMLEIYGVREREDTILGVKYRFKHDLPYQFYFGVEAKYSITDSNTYLKSRGVKLTNTDSALSLETTDIDPSSINMPNLIYDGYVKDAGYAEVTLAKVFDVSAYFFTFPISLQRESFYTKYRRYSLRTYGDNRYDANEVTAGVTLSTVWLNSFVFPLSIEYIHNDLYFVEEETYRFMLGVTF